ncbi:Hemerythrin-like domain-containing protein [Tistlia consotensis]|uniref:Hemerythrin-like domain-containing protein n=1 Tax=Tistlia consotensis USBA 355 TaxID=560819 RepID=A0A1Y6CGP2_9PROT|nr:hemerythrin domain-containing protein [Tistlia consotensis]SMF60528.1 Hemerythrin-like domain-containing protein [Tistlia consotensis USBA 355]SNR93324.1 Hemerythrin-like domain-containing protein [Tistlia consotensis]
MTALVQEITREHRNIAQVLRLLEREIGAFEEGEGFDAELWHLILDYLRDFPARVHHPKEDLIYRRLMERQSEAAPALQDLEAEHVRLAATLDRLAGLVEAVERDVELPRCLLVGAARDFLAFQRTHMLREEESFLPFAESRLTAADWQAVAARAQKRPDPLFDEQEEKRFAELRTAILEAS